MQSWTNSLVYEEATIWDAIEAISRSGMQIALIVSKEKKLLGIITDVDVRRAVLEHIDFSDGIHVLMNRNPVVAKLGQSDEEIRDIMKNRRVHLVPIIDEERHVYGVANYYDYIETSRRDNAVVIMAGGYGERLRPLTEKKPKPMLEVGSKPLLETIIDSFAEKGFHRFYITVNYMANIIEDYFGNGIEKGIEIEYIREEKKLGTAGAIALISDLTQEPFIVMNGDILTKLDYRTMIDYHIAEEAVATMAVREYTTKIPYGVIHSHDNNIVSITEKPEETYLVNAGVYVLSPSVISEIEKGGRLDMPQLFSKLIEKKEKTVVFPVREYWLDIGRIEDLEKAKQEFDNVW